MRAADCSCGEHLEARNGGELLEAAKRHASADHEGQELGDGAEASYADWT